MCICAAYCLARLCLLLLAVGPSRAASAAARPARVVRRASRVARRASRGVPV